MADMLEDDPAFSIRRTVEEFIMAWPMPGRGLSTGPWRCYINDQEVAPPAFIQAIQDWNATHLTAPSIPIPHWLVK